MHQLTDDMITTTQGAELTGYSVVYVRQLARYGVIKAKKLGRDWLVSRAGLLAYKAKMDRLGSEKFNPYREED